MRKHCAALYKDAKLFSGVVRDNIDFSGKFSDELIIKALHYLQVCKVLDADQKNITNQQIVAVAKLIAGKLITNNEDAVVSSNDKKSTFAEFLETYEIESEQEL